MESKLPEILVALGPLAGQRFPVSAEGGLRLGRSSSCEIAVSDPALSRNHCLFEARDGAIWVTDLASANGTLVNDEPLGADSRRLSPGDLVAAGDTVLQVVAPEGAVSEGAPPEGAPAAESVPTEIDLGLGRDATVSEPEGRKGLGRGLLWGVAAVVVLAAAALMFVAPDPEKESPTVVAIQQAGDDTLISVSFERVDASTAGIYRYALEYSADGSLHVEYADVPKENRHLSRTVKLSQNARKRLADIFKGESLYALEPEYAGSGVGSGTLKSRRLKVVRGSRVFETSVENAQPPDALRDVCEQLEAFSKNELGAWALQYSSEKLQAMSVEAVRTADAKWNERDVQHGNLSAAIKAYDEAIVYLDTVNPKPAGYEELLAKRRKTQDELDRRYRDQRFLVDRAVNLGDWAAARRELRILCDMVPDERDPRHAEASAKLIDVENRQKKGGAR